MDQLRRIVASLSLRQQISIGAVVFALGLGLWSFSSWNHERDFKALYSNLSAEDAGAVMEKLQEDGIEYRVDDNGSALRVPSAMVAELRLRMASAGLPKTGRIGFELFDKNSFGLTEFAEQVNYRRAIEGELERSIGSLGEIERARVHISLPKDSVFLESRQEAKASVVVTLRAGSKLSASNGAAITHLVASAVERLAPEAVTVLDSRGNLLVKPRKAAGPGEDVPEVDMEYRQKVERDLVTKIRSTLEPLLGAEKFRASASVDLDFTSGDLSEETFDPTRSVMTASQKTEDVSGTGFGGGAPGTASNLPNPPARAGSGSGTARKTENISYQTSRVVKHTKIPQGALKRMSVAILLDQDVRWEGTGPGARRVLEAPSAEKIKTIRDLVAASTGYSEERGDQITVETLPFEATLGIEPPAAPVAAPAAPPAGGLPGWLQKYVGKAPAALLIGVAAVAAMVVTAGIALLVLRRKKFAKAAVTAQKAISEGGDAVAAFEGQLASRAANQERLEAEALLALKLPPPGTKKSEILAKHLKKSVKTDPAGTAQLLRTWMDEKEA